MAKAGQKAKSGKRHAAEGTKASAKGDDLGTGHARLPAVPKYLPREAKTFWRNSVKWMREMGTLDTCDTMHLEAAAMMWHRLRTANRTLVKEGLFTENEKGVKKRHPAALEAIQMTEKLRMWYNEVGFTPAARAALGRARGPAKQDDDLEDEIFGKDDGKKPQLKVS